MLNIEELYKLAMHVADTRLRGIILDLCDELNHTRHTVEEWRRLAKRLLNE